MLTQSLFFGFVVLVVLQRSAELRVSRHHEAYLRSLGGVEHAPGHFRVMQLLHGCWLACILLEVKLLETPFRWGLAAGSLLVFLVGQWLRLSAMRALGWRWTVRIYTVPSMRAVSHGIYRYLRHPNYLGVVLEIAALPLIHGAWRTALFFSVANAALLAVRINAEERALLRYDGYDASFSALPRLWPRLRSRSSP